MELRLVVAAVMVLLAVLAFILILRNHNPGHRLPPPPGGWRFNRDVGEGGSSFRVDKGVIPFAAFGLVLVVTMLLTRWF